MNRINDVHEQFAAYFNSDFLKPYLSHLSLKMSEGHICINPTDVGQGKNTVSGLLRHPLVSDGRTKAPFILYNERLYLQRYFNYESLILNGLIAFTEKDASGQKESFIQLERYRSLIQALFEQDRSSEKINWQLIATLSGICNRFSIITGGPGTGKTTTVAKILTILHAMNPLHKVALAAPTGKAAARMAESLQQASAYLPQIEGVALSNFFESLTPFTLHRLLGTRKDSIYFKHNRENPLPYDVIIIDESSMIDAALFAKLIEAVDPHTKLIMLGDKDQLASVEAGSLFGDLCKAQEHLNIFSSERAHFFNSFTNHPSQLLQQENMGMSTHPLFEHIIELKESRRFSDEEGIGKFSKAIIHNHETIIRSFFDNKDERILIDTDYTNTIFNTFIEGYQSFLEEKDIRLAIKKINNLKVLCAVREGEQGVIAVNKRIEHYFHQKKQIWITGEFYENRPVMITSNNYELGLYNGDIGIVRANQEGVLRVWFEVNGQLEGFPPAMIHQVETVFAMTIHKSQGSEFEQVLILLPEVEEMAILTRELLYTAVTRARKKVIIQGGESTILQTAKTSVERGSGIKERFLIQPN